MNLQGTNISRPVVPKRDIIFNISKLYLLSCFSGKYQEIPDCESFARHNLLSNAGDPVENIEGAQCTARKHRHTSTIIRVYTIIQTHMKKQSHPTQLPVQMIKGQWESLSLNFYSALSILHASIKPVGIKTSWVTDPILFVMIACIDIYYYTILNHNEGSNSITTMPLKCMHGFKLPGDQKFISHFSTTCILVAWHHRFVRPGTATFGRI